MKQHDQMTFRAKYLLPELHAKYLARAQIMTDGTYGPALATVDAAGCRKTGTWGSAHDAVNGASQNTHENLRIDGDSKKDALLSQHEYDENATRGAVVQHKTALTNLGHLGIINIDDRGICALCLVIG